MTEGKKVRDICIHQIVAVDENYGIGNTKLNGRLPWKLDEEFNLFINKATATKPGLNKVAWVMGRVGFEQKCKPVTGLFHRLPRPVTIVKIVLSRTWKEIPEKLKDENTFLVKDWTEAVSMVNSMSHTLSAAWCFGGPDVYRMQQEMSLSHPELTRGDRIYITNIEAKYDCDLFFPKPDFARMREVKEEVDFDGVEMEDGGVVFKCHVYEFL